MRRATMFCNHYRSMTEHKTCAAGVAYDTMQGVPFDQRPCFANVGDTEPKPGCSLAVLPTLEEQEADERETRDRFEKIGKARKAIVTACGGPWKKGMMGSQGRIDCPACGGIGVLEFSRAGYNGHIHARCKTTGCVSWIE